MIIGITGRSGSGKSTVSKIIAKKFHAYHIDFDKVMHKAIDNNKSFVLETFGNIVLEGNGHINKKRIGDLIFSNRHKYDDYCKKIYVWGLNYLESIFKKKKNVIIDHILLPHMKELWERCDIKILIVADDFIRKERIYKRDNISGKYLEKREAASIWYDQDDYDIIIKNNNIKGIL